uniref:Uncharacterized protein n=1 Tax=Arion vulgaris TaxID=1028688 RepID=A0A0B6YYN4_9EUPU
MKLFTTTSMNNKQWVMSERSCMVTYIEHFVQNKATTYKDMQIALHGPVDRRARVLAVLGH